MKAARLILNILVCAPLLALQAGVQDKPMVTAYPTESPPTLDGQMAPGEYAGTVALFVTGEQPDTVPGFVRFSSPVDDADLSYEIYALYTETDLYVTVSVNDDRLQDDSDGPWQDDVVEIYADTGVRQHQFLVDVGGDKMVGAGGSSPNDWAAAAGQRVRGWVAEFRFPLTLLDSDFGTGALAPGGDDTIGFNVAVGDDDNGGAPYEEPHDSFMLWAGESDPGDVDWTARFSKGDLAFSAAPLRPTAVEAVSWGEVKAEVAVNR